MIAEIKDGDGRAKGDELARKVIVIFMYFNLLKS
jgi:hypothetical protein